MCPDSEIRTHIFYTLHLNNQRKVAVMNKPEIAAKSPFAVNVEKGKDYYWCACGRSKTQPFCDGSHQGSTFAPTKFTADESKMVYLCGCKQSKNGHLCDGTHKSL